VAATRAATTAIRERTRWADFSHPANCLFS
jgi:hypothetical protein